MATDKYWIRASTINNSRLLSKIKLIKNNGILATWTAHKKDAYWEQNIPAGTINRLIKAKDEVSNVSQSYASFGGRKKELISDQVGLEGSIISKGINLRKLVNKFQIKCAYKPPKSFNGSCLDGRDITYNIMPDADFKFFVTASLKTRALRRYKELKSIDKRTNFHEVLKSIKKRDKSDYNRKVAPLKKTKDSVLINLSLIHI